MAAALRQIVVRASVHDELVTPPAKGHGERQLSEEKEYGEGAYCSVSAVIGARITCQLPVNEFAVTQLAPEYGRHQIYNCHHPRTPKQRSNLSTRKNMQKRPKGYVPEMHSTNVGTMERWY
jgi:hypothetical protein